MIALGIDIGGTSTKLAMISGGQSLWTAQSPSYSRPNTEQLISAIRASFTGRNAKAEAVGICVPGVFDREKRCVTLSVNVPGLNGLILDDLVERSLGYRPKSIHITSDAVATAYDIFATRKLAGRLLVLALGTGIGAAVLDDGAPLLIDGNSPGHVGQFDVSLDDHAPIGPDGGAGSLEAYLGAAAIASKHGGDVPSAVRSWRGDEPPLCALARAIRICHAIYRPRHVVLAGGIGIHMGHVLSALRAMVRKDLTRVARSDWTLQIADSDFHAALGAARLAERGRR